MAQKALPQKAFTSKSNQGLLRVLITPVKIYEKPVADPESGVDFNAIWDTGATNSCITKKVIDHLKLKPISITKVSGAFGSEMRNVYLVSIWLPNKVGFPNVMVTECDLKDGDAIIGMDIIAAGDFAVTNKNGITIFSYRYPSLEYIDYVKEANKSKPKKAKQKRRSNKPKRKKRRNPPKRKK